jgi:protein TonB
MPASSEHQDSELIFRLPRRVLRIVGIAFGIGLLLFVIVWWRGRDQGFFKADATAPGTALSEMEPLPEPLPGGDGASDMPAAGKPAAQRPQLVETPPAALPTPIDETAAPTTQDPGPSTSTAVTLAPGDQPVPLPGQKPAPEYPRAALRNRESGTVLVRVAVDASGMPSDVTLEKNSGSRDLDRAALDAVRKWRFQPAQRDGQAVASSLVIPIEFKTEN